MSAKHFFDDDFNEMEQLPRRFTVSFDTVAINSKLKTRISVNSIQVGDVIDDNSKVADGYRFHDVFHYTFATLLGWSPCSRAMIKRKRKSVPSVDDIEDGARATITEEAISLMLFNRAKKKNFLKNEFAVDQSLLDLIKEMTDPFEVAVRSKHEWEKTIIKGYSLFRDLMKNNGGKVHFDMIKQTAIYES
jgi:hypothetical protein